MDYKQMIGQEVIGFGNIRGKIKSVDKQGGIQIKYENSFLPGTYLFDPFLSEYVRFVDENLQKEIDEKIKERDKKQIEIMNKSIAKGKAEETYYITKEDYDGEHKVVLSLKCDLIDAKIVFVYLIKLQQREMREKSKLGFRWQQLRLYESKTDKKIAQES